MGVKRHHQSPASTQVPTGAQAVAKRVDDWQIRVGELYARFESLVATKTKFKARRTRKVQLKVGLMIKHHIKPVTLDILDIEADGAIVLSLIPKAPWVLGANGIVDIVGASAAWTLVDESEFPSSTPKWVLYSHVGREVGRHFDRNAISSLLTSAA
jgi:hypothetical protein